MLRLLLVGRNMNIGEEKNEQRNGVTCGFPNSTGNGVFRGSISTERVKRDRGARKTFGSGSLWRVSWLLRSAIDMALA